MLANLEQPRLLSSTPGRCRIHFPAWNGGGQHRIEDQLRQLRGVRSAQANPSTRNILVHYDGNQATVPSILDFLGQVRGAEEAADDSVTFFERTPVLHEKRGRMRRARVTVRGLDRDPKLAQKIVEHLKTKHGLQATASPMTGRILIDLTHHMVEMEEILGELSHFELPALPNEDHPHHPLDPLPLLQGTIRVIGAAVGIGVIVSRRLLGMEHPLVPTATPARVAGILGLVQGFPVIRNTMRKFFGRTASDLLFYAPVMISLALSESVLGLTLTGVEAMRLLTEVLTRRAEWHRYEERLGNAPSPHAGAVIRIESGQRTPLNAEIIEGTGMAVGPDSLPDAARPGVVVTAGSRLYGGPFVVQLIAGEPFEPRPRPAPPRPTLLDRYVSSVSLLSIAYGCVTAAVGRSFGSFLEGLLLVNPRTAVIGSDYAELSGCARILRANCTIVGTRANRPLRLPDLLLLDGPRLLTEGYELAQVVPLTKEYDASELLTRAAGVAVAAGSPWGGAFPITPPLKDTVGDFTGYVATARSGNMTYALGPIEADNHLLGTMVLTDTARKTISKAEQGGNYPLLLCECQEHSTPRALALVMLRPRMASGIDELVDNCSKNQVELAMLTRGDRAAADAVAKRARISRLDTSDALRVIEERQQLGERVLFVSDSGHAAPAFAQCDLAVALSAGRGSRFPARADLLAPDVGAIAAIIDAAARKRSATRDSVFLSIVANVFGAVWGLRGGPGIERASVAVYVSALLSTAVGWWRLHGGERSRSVVANLADPRPERWGSRSVDSVLSMLNSNPDGLTTEEAVSRLRHTPPPVRTNALVAAILDQFRSPLPGILAVAAGLALALEATLDFVVILATLGVNIAVGTYQELRADQAAEALERLSSPSARLQRDGRIVIVPAHDVVIGDIMQLATGDRIAADGRVIESHGLEVDEAMLTGESHPVPKMAAHGMDFAHVVLEGSDVVAGTAKAVVVAVGRQTRLGATAAALAMHETEQSPLGLRLSGFLRQLLPLAAAGGAVVVGSGLWRGQPLLPQLAVGASIALASVPEGLPLLAGMGEAAVSKRLSQHNALVRRLSAVEALGRVDVACTDKTGTLTVGRLALNVVATANEEVTLPAVLPARMRRVLLTAALACPHPEASDASAHPTDVAVIVAAEKCGLQREVRVERGENAPFDPSRSYHAVVADGRVRLKGAPEVLLQWCTHVLEGKQERPLNEEGRTQLLNAAEALAQRGLRVLLVAEGSTDTSVSAPRQLLALGFVGISDPLRKSVPSAVQKCHEAGIRVIMLTGDHPATARAIAAEAGLPLGNGSILTGYEIAELDDDDLDERLEHTTVIARATPLDKMRIVESLRRHGHTIAMTGDGVNDAPALRLADVGVAMGHAGTEVARQAADMVLTNDDFSTLVEALVEGRSFWRNMRRALALLLGGNLGELGLVVGATALGIASPLTVRQILAVNLITDALPALSVVLQKPEHRNLSALAREGTNAIDYSLRRDVLRRGTATALPAFGAFMYAMRTTGSIDAARTVAFSSIVATQLAQTLDAGWAEGTLTRPVVRAVTFSTGVMLAALTVPQLQGLFTLAMPGAAGWGVTVAAALSAVALNRILAASVPIATGPKVPAKRVRARRVPALKP